MGVIEPEEENEQTLLNNPPNRRSKTAPNSSKHSVTPPPAAAEAETSLTGDDSDGFETASERDVSDNEEEIAHNEGISSLNRQPQEAKADSTQNDDELQQKALAQANDAKLEGNKLFGDGQYEEALLRYDTALRVALDMPTFVELRSICHANRAVCFLKLGNYEDTIKESTKALELNPSYIKALLRRGEAHEKLEHFEEAIADMKKILELNPSNDQAEKTIRRLEPLAAEKREKMKEEMIAKLKDLGNSVLGRFGLSTDNFKAVKDPNTGSYSISFQR